VTEGREPAHIDRSAEDPLSFSDSVSWEVRRAPVIERDWKLLILLIVLVVGGPAIGMVLPGVPGLMVGVVVGILAAVVGVFALTKVVKIERG
jgi:hypothetical protein